MHVGLVIDRLVHVNSLVHIRDVDVVHHPRVVHVYIVKVVRAAVIRRRVQLTKSKRHPGQRWTSHRNSHAPVRPSHPSNQRRRIVWVSGRRVLCNHDGPRTPSPTSTHKHPTPIMKWRKSPIRFIHPSPTPWRNPNPMPKPVRSPTYWHCSRIPDRPILRRRFPAPVVIQVFVTNQRGRDVPRRRQVRFTIIALMAPSVEIILARRLRHGGLGFVPPLTSMLCPGFTVAACPPAVTTAVPCRTTTKLIPPTESTRSR